MVLPFETTASNTDESLLPASSDDPINGWLDRVTRKLGVDREVQLEVRQELRSHLQDAIAELRGAGRDTIVARDEALRALGNEDELADALWKANRRRVSRRAIAMWVARIVLPPTVAALVVYLAAGTILSAMMIQPVAFTFRVSGPDLRNKDNPVDRYRDAAIATAPEDVKKLFELKSWGPERVAQAKALLDLHPADNALYVNYAREVLARGGADSEAVNQTVPSPVDNDFEPYITKPVYDKAKLDETLKVLAEGERREPGNGVYPAMIATLLFNASSSTTTDYSQVFKRPGRQDEFWDREIIYDEKMFADALAATKRASEAEYFRNYKVDLAERKVAVLPAERVADVWLRATAERDVFDRGYGPTEFAWRAPVHATALARQGKRAEADALLRQIRMVAGKMAESAAIDRDVHEASWIARTADEAEARIVQTTGDKAAAEQAWMTFDAKRDRFASIRRQQEQADRHRQEAGLLYDSLLRDAYEFGRADPAPLRRAEYATADQFGLAVSSVVLLAGAAGYAIVASAFWIRAKRRRIGNVPRVFMGWQRLAVVVGMGAVVPVVFYLFYAAIEPLSGRNWGLNATLERVLVEYAALALTVLLLVQTLTRRAVLQRLKEIGVGTGNLIKPMSSTKRVVVIVALTLGVACLILALAASLGTFQNRSKSWDQKMIVALIVTAWISLAFAALVGFWRRGTARNNPAAAILGGIVARSAFVVMLLAALAVAIAAVPLRRVETQNVATVIGDRGRLISQDPVGKSGYEAIRDEMLREYDSMMRQPG